MPHAHCATRLLAAATLAAATLASPAAAQGQTLTVQRVLNTALAEQRVFHTCGVLDPEGYGFLLQGWQSMTEDTLAYLETAGFPPAMRDAFAEAADPEALRLPPETPFAEVIAFCNDNPTWMRQLVQYRMTILPQAIEAALAD